MPHLKQSHDRSIAHAPAQSPRRNRDFLALIFLAALTLELYRAGQPFRDEAAALGTQSSME